MTCQTCGRDDGHYIGCEAVTRYVTTTYVDMQDQAEQVMRCEHDRCMEPKKEWSGKGAKPKYCAAGHKKEK